MFVHHSIGARRPPGNESAGVARAQRLGDDDVYVAYLRIEASWLLPQDAVSKGSRHFKAA